MPKRVDPEAIRFWIHFAAIMLEAVDSFLSQKAGDGSLSA